MKKICSFLIFLNVLLPLGVIADSQLAKKEFNGQELRQIRGVSQAILKVRGQERRQVISETEELRTEVAQVRKIIQDSMTFDGFVDLRGIKDQIHASGTVAAQAGEGRAEPASFIERTKQAWRKITQADNEKLTPSLLREKQLNTGLEKALKITRSRKSKVEENGPAVWEFWSERSKKDARTIRAMDKLSKNLEKIQRAQGEEKQKLLREMAKRMNPPQESKPADPTIFSITKHIRK